MYVFRTFRFTKYLFLKCLWSTVYTCLRYHDYMCYIGFMYSDDLLIRTLLFPSDISGLTRFPDYLITTVSPSGNQFPYFLSWLARFPDYRSPDKRIITVHYRVPFSFYSSIHTINFYFVCAKQSYLYGNNFCLASVWLCGSHTLVQVTIWCTIKSTAGRIWGLQYSGLLKRWENLSYLISLRNSIEFIVNILSKCQIIWYL